MSYIINEKTRVQYRIDKFLGEGTYGKVVLATNTNTNETVAIKELKLKKFGDAKKVLQDELNGLIAVSAVCEKHAVCYKDYFTQIDSTGAIDKAYIVMEYIKGIDLEEVKDSKSLTERQRDTQIIFDLVNGLDAIHRQNVSNQDIKDKNIIYDRKTKHYRYLDWGGACIQKYCDSLGCHEPCGFIGTAYTSPPELDDIYTDTRSIDKTKAHDIWSIGVVILDWYIRPNNISIGDYYYDPHLKTLMGLRPSAPYYLSQEDLDYKTTRVKNKLGASILPLLLVRNWRQRLDNWDKVMDLVRLKETKIRIKGRKVVLPVPEIPSPKPRPEILALDTQKLFAVAQELYTFDYNLFYSSDKDIEGLYLTVYPYIDKVTYSYFNFGDDADIVKVYNISKQDKIFKTFGCSHCTVFKNDNTVAVSKQSELHIDTKSPYAQIQLPWQSLNGINYLVTGTFPQFNYSDLILMSQDHIPMYNFFTIPTLFKDVFDYLNTQNSDIIATFSGATSSNITHFHVYLTERKYSIINFVKKILQENVETIFTSQVFYYELNNGVVDGLVLASLNVFSLFVATKRVALYTYISSTNRDNIALTANIFVQKIKNTPVAVIILHWINLDSKKSNANRLNRVIDDCVYTLVKGSYTVNASCFNVSPDDYLSFTEKLKNAFDDIFLPIKLDELVGVMNNPNPIEEFNAGIINTVEDLRNTSLEKLWNLVDINYRHILPSPIQNIVLQLITQLDCYTFANCNSQDFAKFLYFLGLYIANLTEPELLNFINSGKMAETRIQATLGYLQHYNIANTVTTHNVQMRGLFLNSLLLKTFTNLLLITQNKDTLTDIISERITINKWMDFILQKAGHTYTALGTVGHNPDINFEIKIALLFDASKNIFLSNIYNEFKHELFASIQLNSLRNLVPNYRICYGGYTCNSTDITKMCNTDFGGYPFAYILYENRPKDYFTLTQYSSETMVQDVQRYNAVLKDIILQVLCALCYGWKLYDFTHYNLNLDNILLYNLSDFVVKKYSEMTESISKISDISNIFFIYYAPFGKGDEIVPIIIPCRYLTLIVDYSTGYVKGVTSDVVNEQLQREKGITNNKSNSVADVYTFLMSVLFYVCVYNPQFIFMGNEWLNNSLARTFIKFLSAYTIVFNNVDELVKRLPSVASIEIAGNDTHSRIRIMNEYIFDAINPAYRLSQFYYLSPKIKPENIIQDFNNPIKVLIWVYGTMYNYTVLKNELNKPNVYTFVWGTVPNGMQQGLQPNNVVIERIAEIKQGKNNVINRLEKYEESI